VRYRAAIEAVLALSPNVTCSETIAKADEYTSAKLDYYQVARAVIPILFDELNADHSFSGVVLM
jgi:hypothetical protein